jgi:integrase/recombinase XerD
MKPRRNSFQFLIQKYFLQWMMAQRNVSPDTIKSYRDTFRLYLQHIETYCKVPPSSVTIHNFEAETILSFLDSLERDRRNQPNTINNRLAALHSFLKFLSFELPEYSGLLTRSLMIPFRKEEKRQMEILLKEEFQAMQDVCETTVLGRRDKLMLLLLYNTGVRVSELISIRGRDIQIDSNGIAAYIRVHGKGRKERDVPLWKNTAKFLYEYLSTNHIRENDKLFMNCTENELTRSGVRYRIDCLKKKAAVSMPSLLKKNVTPHTFRHTTALHLLQSGVDISTIAIWLGHESIITTHKYMEADMDMKRQILEKMSEPSQKNYHFIPEDSVLTFLDSL